MAERGSRRRVRARAISEASEALWLSSARGRRAGDPHSARCSRLPVCWRSGAEDTVVRSCSGDAVVCTLLGLAWVVSARPGSPRGTGAKRERRSGSWLWPGAAMAAAGEAGERERRRDRRLSGRQLPLHVRKDPSSKCAAGPTVNVHRRVEDSRATGATEEEGRTEGERSVLPGKRSEQRHERELRKGRLCEGQSCDSFLSFPLCPFYSFLKDTT
ncbi:uncharacterized protein O3Q21_005784 [Podargus strigoides]